MAGRFVRASKFRHVFGSAGKKNELYDGIRVTKSAFDGAFCAVNPKFLAVCIDASGGGAFLVLPLDKTGRQDVNAPRVCAHATDVLDLAWNPFDDNIIASCAEDGSIKIWQIPDKGLFTNLTESLLTFEYHQKRCTQVTWHPSAANILMSVSQDPSIIVWNLDDGSAVCEIDCHPDVVYNASFNKDGSKIVTSCKDKKFRIIDARSGEVLKTGGGHEGAKPQRVIFIDNNRLCSTGFSKMSERQYAIWNEDDLSEPLMIEHLDAANGALVPIYDGDTQMVYLAAKGDSVIRYYELDKADPYIHYISTFQSSDPQRGLNFMPKRGVDVNKNEVMRFFKIHSKGLVEPISFTVPRKSDQFQDDLYPDAASAEPAVTAEEWQNGKDADPKLMSMRTGFHSKEKNVKAIKGLGGLKKGGLKGKLPTKTAEPEAEKEPEKAKSPASAAPAPVASTPASKVSKPAASNDTAVSSKAPSGADAGTVKQLQDEIKHLKDNEKKLQAEIKSLKDQLKDHAKLLEDLKSLKVTAKKNDERITTLEGLVQEETESEEEKGK